MLSEIWAAVAGQGLVKPLSCSSTACLRAIPELPSPPEPISKINTPHAEEAEASPETLTFVPYLL